MVSRAVSCVTSINHPGSKLCQNPVLHTKQSKEVIVNFKIYCDPSSAGTDFKRQNLTFKFNPTIKEQNMYNGRNLIT